MKLTIEHEKNYAAEAVYIDPAQVITYPELMNLVGFPWVGYTVLITKSMVGKKAVMFPAESQLSEEVARVNNLYAKAELNADPTEKGYLGKNRRVRAIKLRGINSNALAIPAESLGNPPLNVPFDTIDGKEICRKYVVPTKPTTNAPSRRNDKLWKRVDNTLLPEHYDTGQYWRESDKFAPSDYLVVTQKIHGSSVRIGHIPVRRKPTWKDKVLNFFGIETPEFDYAVVGGSRKVVKDPNNPEQNHYYGEGNDIWTQAALTYGHLVPKNVVLYGELYGFVPGTETPIQKGYTYDAEPGEMKFLVYRVATVQEDGGIYDLSWNGVKEFCRERGLNTVPELARTFASLINPEEWTDENFRQWYDEVTQYIPSGSYIETPIPLCNESPCDEGVVVRRDGVIPFALKIKSPVFYEYETKALDAQETTENEVME